MRFGQGLLAALENEDEMLDDEMLEEEVVDPEVEAEQDAEDVDNAVEVASDDIEEAETQTDVLEDTATELEEVEEALEAMKAHEGDIPAFATKMLHQKLSGVHRRTGMTFSAYSGESADLSDASVIASLEDSVKDRLKQVGEYIMKLIRQAKEFFKNLWDRLTSGSARVSARANKLAGALKGKDITEEKATEVAARLVEKKGEKVKGIAVVENGKLTIGRDLQSGWENAKKAYIKLVSDENTLMAKAINETKELLTKEGATEEDANAIYAQLGADGGLSKIYAVPGAFPGGMEFKLTSTVKATLTQSEAAKSTDAASLKDGLVEFASYGDNLQKFAGYLVELTSDKGLFSKEMAKNVDKLYSDMEKAVGVSSAAASKELSDSKIPQAVVRKAAAFVMSRINLGAREGRKAWLRAMGDATVVIGAFVSAAGSEEEKKDDE